MQWSIIILFSRGDQCVRGPASRATTVRTTSRQPLDTMTQPTKWLDGATGSEGPGAKKPEGIEDSDTDEETETDAKIEALSGQLERERPDHEGLVIVRLRDFQAFLRYNGDGWQGQVKRRGVAQAWHKAAGLRQTFQANVKLGFDNAKILAGGWAHRMQLL